MRVRWTVSARRDLELIAKYLHENAPAVASDILAELYTEAMALGVMPYVGRLAESGKSRALFVADNYLVTYRIDRDAVHVVRIRHTSRKPLKS